MGCCMGPSPIATAVDLRQQSVASSNGSGSRISPLCKDGELTQEFEGVRTMYEAFRRGLRESDGGPCLGARTGPNKEYEYLTYNEVLTRVRNVGSGLIARGVKPKDFVGIFASNCIDWVVTSEACNTYSLVSVPLYDTLGSAAITHILNQADLSVVVCDAAKVSILLDQVPSAPKLRTIVKMGALTKEEEERVASMDVQLLCLADLETQGSAALQDDIPPEPSDLCTICYTSGTTGLPKGAMLSHGNIIADISGLVFLTQNVVNWGNSTVHLSYLPLAHMFERGAQAVVFAYGGRIGFFQGDIKLLMEDLGELKPTLFPSVPRLLNRVYDKVMDGVAMSSPIKRAIFNLAMSRKRSEVSRGVIRRDSIWDKLVFNKIQQRLGGNVEVLVTGAAPISDAVLDFLRCAMGCPVLQGYGQTESSAGATITIVGDSTTGNVGPPLSCNEIKLVSVPELGYLAEEGRGEVCFRGHNIFKGYLKDEAKTKDTIDEEGWLHSGDIGRWNDDGTLSIIDRKKQIFKLAQGEYVAPEKVEMAYQCAPLVGQVFLHGDSLQSACVAIIVPDEVTLPRWATEHHIAGNMEELCENEAVRKAVLSQLTELGKKSGLKSFEQAKALHLHPKPFTVEEELMTPTFKLKRPQLKSYFNDKIEGMYAQLA
eukprot:scpid39032/ scgid0725/ Long-chain-fatty-acid--CoA ligase 5; Long-chain acyl-CoA synthetase 5